MNRSARAGSKMRWVLPMVAVTACASTETLLQGPPDDSIGVPDAPEPDGGLDATLVEADARPCSDCEYFPDICSPDILCPNGPFGATNPGGRLDQARTTISTIRGRSNSDVWAVGTLGAAAHFDGAAWTPSDLGSRDSVNALWLRDDGEVTFGTPARVYTRGLGVVDAGAAPSGGGWSFNVPTISAPLSNLVAVLMAQIGSSWGMPGANWFWTTAIDERPVRRVAGLWRMRRLPSHAFEAKAGIAIETCQINSCMKLKGIHGASADELWAVGVSGSAVLVTDADSDAPSVKAFNTQTWNTLNAVWVSSTGDAWAVGAGGTVRHYTGDPVLWDVIPDVPTKEDLRAVWGSSSRDIWAVGDAALVLHYDGNSWSRVKIAELGLRRPNLTTVWVAAPGHVWIGGEGVILSLGGKA